ncbi:uncharacterized protein [Neodiprion pinetum]|uniref:Uncharacterized protein LOC107218492 isoform X1 n=2 Tax=Neodiprion lecontei TaxID=441921 RepID=A0ABM3GPR3_NEOLC|nr:uncharacterized protein LOC124223121 isoform X1 [Neodiprion pinetum]XP_046602258.1 uncharacterized protein LOC107218492 isoform X1 [Neodiprion lecontei]
MPLSMTLNESNKIPFVMPCFDGEELHVDLELMNAGLAAISVKEQNAEDTQEEANIRHRNSFWNVHRPELSKLSWAVNHTPKNIETYLKNHAENRDVRNDLLNCNISPADFNQLTVIHATSDRHASSDQNYLLTSKPQTIQFNDDDLASPTTLHKSRAEFCVTIGSIEEKSIPETSEPSSSKISEENTMTWNNNNRASNSKVCK